MKNSNCKKELMGVYIIWYREMLLYFRNKIKLFTSFFVPIMLTIFLGSGLASFFPTAIEVENFSNFFYSGVLVLSIAVNVFDATVSLVWDKEFGFMREILVAPLSKTKIVLGKTLGAVTRGLMQGVALLVVAPVLGINLYLYQIFLLLLLMILISVIIASLGIIVASFIRRIETFSLFSQIFIAPLLFLSGAFFTLEKIPHWMQMISYFNPLFYTVNGIRILIFNNDFMPERMSNIIAYNFNFGFIVLIVFALVSMGIAVMAFNRLSVGEVIKKILEETEDMI